MAGGRCRRCESGRSVIPDGLAVLNKLLLSVKAPGRARHSTSTSLMRAGLVKAGPKPLNEPSASLVHVMLS